MAKRQLFIECFEDTLMSYGYSYDDVQELLHVYADMDADEVEVRHHSVLLEMATETFRYHGVEPFRDEFKDFRVDFASKEVIKVHRSLADFITTVMEVPVEDADTYAWAAIVKIVSPMYWKYAQILMPVYHILNIHSTHIPADVVAAAWAEAHQEHWFDVRDECRKLWGKK